MMFWGWHYDAMQQKKNDTLQFVSVAVPVFDAGIDVIPFTMASLYSESSDAGTGLLHSRECLSHDTTYFRMSARTFESMLWRGSNIRVK